MLNDTYIFACERDDDAKIIVSGSPLRIDCVVTLFSEFLAGCGFHPDNIKDAIIQEDQVAVSVDEYCALSRMKAYIAFEGKPKDRADLLKEIKELLA